MQTRLRVQPCAGLKRLFQVLANLGEVDAARRRDLVDLLFVAKLLTCLSFQGRDAGASALGPIEAIRFVALNIVHNHHISVK